MRPTGIPPYIQNIVHLNSLEKVIQELRIENKSLHAETRVKTVNGTWHGMAWYGMAWHGVVRHGAVWHDMVGYGTVWYGCSQAA